MEDERLLLLTLSQVMWLKPWCVCCNPTLQHLNDVSASCTSWNEIILTFEHTGLCAEDDRVMTKKKNKTSKESKNLKHSTVQSSFLSIKPALHVAVVSLYQTHVWLFFRGFLLIQPLASAQTVGGSRRRQNMSVLWNIISTLTFSICFPDASLLD